MKKYLLLITLLTCVCATAQLTNEDFEGFNTGSFDGQFDPNQWDGWWGTNSLTEISSEYANSGNNSLNLSTAGGGAADIVGLFGTISEGKWELKFMQYLPTNAFDGSNAGAYYNLQHNYVSNGDGTGSGVWACGIYMPPDADGPTYIAQDGKQSNFQPIRDQWVEHKFIIDIDNNLAEFFYNDVKITDWPWNTEENGGGDNPNLNGLNLFAYCGGDFPGCSPDAYYDDIALTELESVPPLTEFSLLAPEDGASVDVNSTMPESVNISWGESISAFGNDVTYSWKLYSESGSPLLSLSSNNAGLDTELSLSNSIINNLLDNFGVEVGGNVTLTWNVEASSDDIVLESTETFSVTFNKIEDETEPVSLEEIAKEITVYPNPANNQVTIEGEVEGVNIYGITGQLFISTTDKKIDLSNLADGVYLVELQTAEGVITEKLRVLK